jgi:cyclin B
LLQNRAESAQPKAAAPLSPLPDIDSVDKHNPLAAAEYASSIFDYYRRVEPKFSVPHDYMKSQVGPVVCVLGLMGSHPSTAALPVQPDQ